jgi:hypothetical protein
MKRTLAAAMLLLCSEALPKKNHAPLPDGVQQAKTIYLSHPCDHSFTFSAMRAFGRTGGTHAFTR